MSKILTNTAGNLRLELRDDRLSAWLTVMDKNKLTDEDEILALVETAGIKTGFEEALKYMRKHGMEKEYNIPFPLAICDHVKGETKLNYYFNLDTAKRFDGKVTAQELNALTCIEAGTVVADYSSNIFDRRGSIYDIYGEMLHDEEFDLGSVHQIAGENVTYDLQKHQVKAECAGFPSVDESGRISIVTRLKLEGDIRGYADVLRSPVALEICGNVESTRITAAGDVTIRGRLANSEVWCEGDLTVEGEIQNCVQPEIKVWGDLNCGGIVGSKILCLGRIEFEGNICQSEVVADKGVISKTGTLAGGHLECCNDIELGKLGDSEGTPTDVEVTISPFHKALLMLLTKEMIHLKQDTYANADAIEVMNNRIKTCEVELDNGLNVYLQSSQTKKIKLLVHQDVYPPVQIRILKHEYSIKNHQVHLEILEKD